MAVCVGFALFGAGRAAAQTQELAGRVLARDGAALAEAVLVQVGTPGVLGYSDASGTFRIRVSGTAPRVVVRRIGYAADTLPARDGMVFRLRAAAVELDPIVVAADRGFTAASSRVVRDLDIQLRPRASAQELLRLAPGLVIAQHAGGGKAEQIFLRGFDADHGTDVAVSVDGVPVNMTSHAHGQGYADLHFLMPEVVEEVVVRKGAFDARDGDLATAGAVLLRTRDRIDAPRLFVRGGRFNTGSGTALVPFGGDATEFGGFVAGSLNLTDGPVEASQDYRRFNGFGKLTAPLGPRTEFVAHGSAFDSRWFASGQVPDRAVASGQITRFGSLDPTEGGRTSRYDASAGVRGSLGRAGSFETKLWASRYRFQLFSNFTFFARDSVNGDGIEQVDVRELGGVQANIALPGRLFGLAGETGIGADLRADFADVSLFDQVARARLGTRVASRIRQTHADFWARRSLLLAEGVRLELGVRGDLFRFSVRDRGVGGPAGSATRAIVSPKANLAIDLARATTLFVNGGFGFHSNDARDVVQATTGDRVLPRSTSGELGLRHFWRGGTIAASAWLIDLQSELVFVGDEGVTEASGRTRRLGADVEGRLRLRSWLWADTDLSVARGRLRDEAPGENRVPLAPTVTLAAGLTVKDAGPVAGGLRVRHIGDRAAIEDASITARGSTVTELFGSYRIGAVELTGTVDNLFNVVWNEAQFATESRLRGESAAVNELHFTPGAPRNVQLGARYRF